MHSKVYLKVFFSQLFYSTKLFMGFPGDATGKEPPCQCRGCRFDPWVRKIPSRRKWQPTPVLFHSLPLSCFLQVARVSVGVNNHLQAKMTKKTSQKPPTTRNLRKIRGSKLCSQCSKVNEELNQNGPEEVPESMETPVIPAGPVGSQ